MDLPKDVYPTPLERELWAKAVQTPDQVTEAERLVVLRQADLNTQIANALEVSGLAPEELENKALTSPESMTFEECRLMRNGYHIWDPWEATANSKIHWCHEDRTAHMKARRALVTPRDDAVSLAVSRRGNDFSAARAKETKARLESYAEDMKQPCKWVRKLIDPSVSWSDQTRRWGFVVFRDGATNSDSNNDSWVRFLTVMDSCVDEGLRLLKGGTAIIPTKEFTFLDGLVSESSPEILRSIFRERVAGEVDPNPRILTNTFLLVTPEVVNACINTRTPWIWAYDAKFVPSTTPPPPPADSAAGAEHYEGRLKVSLYTLLTWFYAVRSEELYSMALFWELAQKQPVQAWSVQTQSGLYHHPLVLLKKGTLYPFNTYELENDP
ncbi:hypothetical protein VF21_00857 [Pseudogymnoascus sp. 05NY08]|nr:hypothetical protein VF21_00857 [Pseudogymnoascus sp. 05NY08]